MLSCLSVIVARKKDCKFLGLVGVDFGGTRWRSLLVLSVAGLKFIYLYVCQRFDNY